MDADQSTNYNSTTALKANHDDEIESSSARLVEAAGDDDDTKNRNCCTRMFIGLKDMLFPKLTPLPWSTFFVLSVFVLFPSIIYILLFTKMGFGIQTYNFFNENFEEYSFPLGAVLAAIVVLLYLTDCYHWNSAIGRLMQHVFAVVIFLGIIFFVILSCDDHPYGPIALYIVSTAIWLAIIGVLFSNQRSSSITARTYVTWLSGPLFFVSAVVFLSWLIWTFLGDQNEWSIETALLESEEAGCEADFTNFPDCHSYINGIDPCFYVDPVNNTIVKEEIGTCDDSCVGVYNHCFNTFIIWVGPFLVSLGLLFLSFFATFLRSGGRGEGDDVDAEVEKETGKFAKLWIFIVFAIWVGASLAGAGVGISTTLAALTFASFVASAIFISISYDKNEREERLTKMKAQLAEKYGGFADVFRGLLVLTCTPVFLLYFFVSFVKQQIRNLTCCTYSKPPADTMSLRNVVGGQGNLTIEARRLVREFLSWDRTKVFTYAIYWGLFYMIMSVVVSQFTLVFLSYLIEETADMNLYAVTGILIAVGMVLFLLPPVPGVPIYLTMGIVILPIGRPIMGLVGSMAFCLVVSLLLKLLACTLQQKMIGELLKSRVSVRQMVSVNSKFIRSMKLVLKEPGFSIPKVCILIGGPDWPTSVLCGIMGLPLLPILVGTLPVIFLIAPTMLTGAFTYMGSLRDENNEPEFAWASTMATVFAAVTAVVQLGSMVFAAHYLDQAVSNKTEELETMPFDEEVRIADEKNEENVRKYEQVVQWQGLPWGAKALLIVSLSFMISSVYLVVLFLNRCFTEFQLTDTIDKTLGGNWLNLVQPLGWVSIGLLVASVVVQQIFVLWAKRAQNRMDSSSIYDKDEDASSTNYVEMPCGVIT